MGIALGETDAAELRRLVKRGLVLELAHKRLLTEGQAARLMELSRER